MVVYFREKHVSIKQEASTHTDLQLKGPVQHAEICTECPHGRLSLKHCKIGKGGPEYISLVIKLLSWKLPVRGKCFSSV